jgi:transposase
MTNGKSKAKRSTTKAKNSTKRMVIKQNVGVDIAKKEFKACIYQLFDNQECRVKASRTFSNTAKGFEAFLIWVNQKCVSTVPIRVTMEATGVYYEGLTYFLDDYDIYVSVVLPNKAKFYAKSLGLKSKTDKIDAQMLGQMGLERDLPKWKAISSQMRTLKQLCRERVNIIEDKTALGNQLHALKASHQADDARIERLNERIDLCKKQLKAVETEIKILVKNDDKLSKHVDNISKVKGLGIITIATIFAETDGFNLIGSRKQLVSYAGYDVVQRQSGTSINGKTRISKKGNRFIRRALHFPAMVAVRHDKQINQFYQRTFEKSYIKMKAYVAVQRKLLLLIYALFKKNEAYNPDFLKTEDNDKSQKNNNIISKAIDNTIVEIISQ